MKNKTLKMNPKDKELLDLFADRLKKRIPNVKIWAFGSRARGEANLASDFDILVVLPEINSSQKNLISEIAWEISYEHEILLAPITYSLEKFNYPAIHKSSFIQNILREGIAA